MAVYVSRISGEPRYDSIPVAKITDYPLEKESYKPFAQSQLCIGEKGLILRLWAFEVDPPRQSALRVGLGLGERRTALTVYADGRLDCAADGAPAAAPIFHHMIAGEDLQGEYWGAVIVLSGEILKALLGIDTLTKDIPLRGNLYKLSDAPGREHYGSHFPVDFTAADPYGPEYFGDLTILDY
jgi:hypothetical protein